MALDITKFLLRFVEEAKDHLEVLNQGVAELESGAASTEQINLLFRAAHTLKGSARMLKLEGINQTAHSLEDLLTSLRDGSVKFDATQHAALIYAALDNMASATETLAQSRDPKSLPAADDVLCEALKAAAQGQASDQAADTGPQSETEAPPALSTAETTPDKLKARDTVRVPLTRLDELIRLMGEMVSSHSGLRQLVEDARRLQRQSLHQPELGHLANRLRDRVQAQEALMTELHDTALQMRMLPLSIIFDPAGRLIRDLARSLGKEVEAKILGSEIELDRQIIDQLADPIIHLLRNALDHGIETPEERKKVGKPLRGRVSLKAWQDGAWVVVSVEDDGRGISLDAIRRKALKKALLTQEQLDALSEQEIMDLIFLPGFSSTEMITDFSGRGVGMDVVKSTVVDQLQGVVSLRSQPEKGSQILLRLPLSLAVMRVLLVQVQGEILGFTAQYVSELVTVAESGLVDMAQRKAVILRNEFVPVVDLADLLALPAKPSPIRRHTDSVLLLIAQVHHEKLALRIDRLVDERDLVIKQLPAHLRQQPMVSGMVTTGHNQLVSLIHVPYLMEIARQTKVRLNQRRGADQEARQKVLVVDDSLNTREIEKDVLEAWGYEVTLAENGQDGYDKAMTSSFDAVLTDVEMPVMDGFSLTARLRQTEDYATRPIIIVTSREKESDRRRGIEVGADAYIVKGSFDQTSLVDTLKALLG